MADNPGSRQQGEGFLFTDFDGKNGSSSATVPLAEELPPEFALGSLDEIDFDFEPDDTTYEGELELAAPSAPAYEEKLKTTRVLKRAFPDTSSLLPGDRLLLMESDVAENSRTVIVNRDNSKTVILEREDDFVDAPPEIEQEQSGDKTRILSAAELAGENFGREAPEDFLDTDMLEDTFSSRETASDFPAVESAFSDNPVAGDFAVGRDFFGGDALPPELADGDPRRETGHELDAEDHLGDILASVEALAEPEGEFSTAYRSPLCDLPELTRVSFKDDSVILGADGELSDLLGQPAPSTAAGRPAEPGSRFDQFAEFGKLPEALRGTEEHPQIEDALREDEGDSFLDSFFAVDDGSSPFQAGSDSSVFVESPGSLPAPLESFGGKFPTDLLPGGEDDDLPEKKSDGVSSLLDAFAETEDAPSADTDSAFGRGSELPPPDLMPEGSYRQEEVFPGDEQQDQFELLDDKLSQLLARPEETSVQNLSPEEAAPEFSLDSLAGELPENFEDSFSAGEAVDLLPEDARAIDLPEASDEIGKMDTVALLESGLGDDSGLLGEAVEMSLPEELPEEELDDLPVDLSSLPDSPDAFPQVDTLDSAPSDELMEAFGELGMDSDLFGDESLGEMPEGADAILAPEKAQKKSRPPLLKLATFAAAKLGLDLYQALDRRLDFSNNWGLYCYLVSALLAAISLAVIISAFTWG
jgi:hypothetical protein